MRNYVMVLEEFRECQSCKKYGISVPLIYDESDRWICPMCDKS